MTFHLTATTFAGHDATAVALIAGHATSSQRQPFQSSYDGTHSAADRRRLQRTHAGVH